MPILKKNTSLLSEPKSFLKKHPEIKSFDIVMHDCNAIGRGKIIRRNELLKLYESGRQFPLSLLGMDITGEDVPDTGLILEQGDGDIKAWPIAKSLNARRLLLMTNVEGVLDKNNKLITEISSSKILEMIKDEIITGGMIPKINTCLDAVKKGVRGVVIMDGRKNHSILDEIFSDSGVGTLIR